MKCKYRLFVLMLAAFFAAAFPTLAQDAEPDERAKDDGPPSIADKTEGMERLDGLLTFFVDDEKNAVWLLVPPAGDERGVVGQYIYVEGITTGLGSNPVGLDRGQLGPSRLVEIRRIGGRVVIEQVNTSFRAMSENPAEQQSVREAFATSVLWAGEIAARDDDDNALVDLTSFVVQDAHNSAVRLKGSNQGAFSLDAGRSFIDPGACFAFPDNIELEAVLTLSSSEPGRLVRGTAPTGQSVTIVQHHSFIRLPDDGYTPRVFDSRMASFSETFQDYAAALDEPLVKRWIARHRLQKTDPNASSSPVVEPIVYYVDRGAPEPIRSALIEGASWWADAFAAAGFEDAFRVEVLPDDAHPLDVRYNVIQWVHRSTRGWSYGGSVSDPRTGEIIKGHVSLGSLRVRQDRMIFEGLLGVASTGTGAPGDPVEVALARIRQLSAHEVGHTLGFAHNFAASTYGGRASVMDYPAPLVRLDANGQMDVSDAYAVGIGIWDKHAVRFAYSEFAPGVNEDAALEEIVRDGLEAGFLFISDSDARPAGAAHPLANLWDNGSDPIEALAETLRVRRAALENFGERNLPAGQPLAELHQRLVPIYLLHRYQLAAAVKMIGGVQYSYAVLGDGQAPSRPIDPVRQREALDLILQCTAPAFLDLPDSLLDKISALPFGGLPGAELFDGSTSPIFDSLAAASTASDMALAGLLQRERCARIVDFHRRDPNLPSLDDVINAILVSAFPDGVERLSRHEEIRRSLQRNVVERLLRLDADPGSTHGVRLRVASALDDVRSSVERRALNAQIADARAHYEELARVIERHQNRPLPDRTPAVTVEPAPPGDPIGAEFGHIWGECSMGG